jgi:hypothetical protein
MKLRREAFPGFESNFYNGGGILQSANDFKLFSDLVLAKQIPAPKVLIIGVDPWWLRTDWQSSTSMIDDDVVYTLSAHLAVLKNMLIRKRYPLFVNALRGKQNENGIGMMASSGDGNGFRLDGSVSYHPSILIDYQKNPKFQDREEPPMVERIRSHKSGRFGLPFEFSFDHENLITNSLLQLQQTGIEVWVLFPPFSSDCSAALDETNEYREWLEHYRVKLPNILKQNGIRVIITSPEAYGLTDQYMEDGIHPGEVFMAHMIHKLVQDAPDSSLLKRINAEELMARIKAAPSPLSLDFPPAEART